MQVSTKNLNIVERKKISRKVYHWTNISSKRTIVWSRRRRRRSIHYTFRSWRTRTCRWCLLVLKTTGTTTSFGLLTSSTTRTGLNIDASICLLHSGSKLLKKPKICSLEVISQIFQSNFQQICIIFLSCHCIPLIFKICQNVAGMKLIILFCVIFGRILQFGLTVCCCFCWPWFCLPWKQDISISFCMPLLITYGF